MLFDHSRIRMAEVPGEHHEGHAVHDGVARVGVPKLVKRDCLGQVGMPRRLDHAAHLVTLAPRLAVFAKEQNFPALPTGANLTEEFDSFMGQVDRTGFPVLRLGDKDRLSGGVEVFDAQAGEFAIASPRVQRGAD